MKKSILQQILKILAKLTVKKYRPIVVGITGSVGKTSTKEAIHAVLKHKYWVRKSEKSFNTEVGLPLAILGIENHHKKILAWAKDILKSFFRILFVSKYPEILLLEFGVQKPKDMSYLLSIAKPFIGVVTAIGEVPVHVEFFAGPYEVAEEKSKLIKALPDKGFAILNYDDEAVYEMKKKSKSHVMTFGFHKHSDLKILGYELRAREEGYSQIPDGITVKIEYGGNTIPVRLNNCFGKPQVYSAAAACVVGLAMNMNLVEIAESLQEFKPPPGRLGLVRGIKNSLILDDTYNASPEAMHIALDTLRDLPAKRKIAVLGDMLEIGQFTEQAHRTMGLKAGKFCDIVFTVGDRAKFIADEAKLLCKIASFDNPIEAGKALDPLIEKGDLILVKGSQSMRMEKVIEEIMAEPEKAGELLVRQDDFWKELGYAKD